MAQAIFKSWFVDFDPVKAKIAAIEQGKDPLRAAMRAISGKTDAELTQMLRGHHDQLAATAALFPDAMEESELGEIPKGWEVKRIGDLIELAYGKALKSTDRQDGPVPVYGSGGVTGYHNEALVPHGSIIVGRKGTVGSLYWEDESFFPIDTTFYVKPKAVPMTYCFYAMQILGLDKMNTDAAVPGLNRENVYRLELVKPSVSVLNAFDGLFAQMRKTMRANETESRSLAELRDTLLPKLLSGELSVADLDKEAYFS
ncbi:restriction endonuclease subunit S [Nitrosomonas europaea]|uniref:restriction endonuclease subunit S n=1 Tax=Nitrosomonas europaea TaxID=915 RepID=UPI003264A479